MKPDAGARVGMPGIGSSARGRHRQIRGEYVVRRGSPGQRGRGHPRRRHRHSAAGRAHGGRSSEHSAYPAHPSPPRSSARASGSSARFIRRDSTSTYGVRRHRCSTCRSGLPRTSPRRCSRSASGTYLRTSPSTMRPRNRRSSARQRSGPPRSPTRARRWDIASRRTSECWLISPTMNRHSGLTSPWCPPPG